MQKELGVAIEIAREAGEIMRQYFYADQSMTRKDDLSPLTIADTTINKMVIERLARFFPDDGVIGEEESTSEYGLGRKWICDPIDGTKAYTARIPTAMFSLALVVDGIPTIGVAYEPMLDQMYSACLGEGAFCNGRKLTVSNMGLDEGTLATSGSIYRLRKKAPFLDPLLLQRVDMRVASGVVAACVRVAEGYYIGFIDEIMNLHDIAAGHVIVTEAGGEVTTPYGESLDYTSPQKGAVVTNGKIHDELTAIIKSTGTGF